MIESLRYKKRLPDDEYVRYSVSREECRDFKRRADEFSYYPNWDYILLRNKRLGMEKHTAEVSASWEYLKEQNVKKANYICSGGYEWPATKDEVAQMNIFLKQKAKYQSGADCRIPVLKIWSYPPKTLSLPRILKEPLYEKTHRDDNGADGAGDSGGWGAGS